MQYQEFISRGEGPEKLLGSDRNHPRYLLGAPIRINKYNVKTVEIPLTFSPKVHACEYVFTTTYLFDSGANGFRVTDTIVFASNEILTGQLVVSKMLDKLKIHDDTIISVLATAYGSNFVNGTAFTPPITDALTSGQLSATPPQFVVQTAVPVSGIPLLTVHQTGQSSLGTLSSCSIDLVDQCLLADLFDFPHFSNAIILADTLSGGYAVSDASVPIMRTRPSYVLLHSNLRQAGGEGAIARPNNLLPQTVLAKIPLRMDSTQTWGETAQVWTNEVQHPDLFFRGDNRDYNDLEFWMTYPDGLTGLNFAGNSFSLTLSMLVIPFR